MRSLYLTPLAAAWFAVAVAPAPAQPPGGASRAKGPAVPPGTKVDTDLAYGDHDRQKLDLYRPKGDAPTPLVVWVHGGGWEAGSKSGGNPMLPLLARGYAVAAVNYRLSQHAPFPAQIEDVKAAVRFLRANAKAYDLDPDHFGAAGASAGGHLVALLGTSAGAKDLDGDGKYKDVSSAVQAVCDIFGPTDLVKLSPPGATNNPVTRLLGGTTGEKKALAARANPISFVDPKDPPFLILHGDKDTLVPVSQSELFRAALQKAGVANDLIVVPGAGHGPGVFTKETAAKIEGFFDKYLKAK